MKIVGYVLGFMFASALVNLLERWVRAYEANVHSGMEIAQKAMDNMNLSMTELIEWPED